MEFFKDGKFKMINKLRDKTMTQEGTYKLDGDTLKLTEQFTVSIKLKTLTDEKLVLGSGKSEQVFKKVKAKK
jgi:hypothetical protein